MTDLRDTHDLANMAVSVVLRPISFVKGVGGKLQALEVYVESG
jgi:hypothetical protein